MLDFTHSYSMDWIEAQSSIDGHKSLHYIDCSGIGGTDMYCTPEADEALMEILGKYPLRGIHFIDSGNYHYMTRLFTKLVKEPYQLVFFDNHNDMQPTMIPDLLSCGAWAKQSIEEDPFLEKLVVIGPAQSTLDEIQVENREKLVCISWEELESWQNECGAEVDLAPNLPLYISVDKDVLSEEYARTNWDQGQMSLMQLMDILLGICDGRRILGVDICGELPNAPTYEAAKVQRINEGTNTELYRFFDEQLG